MTSKPVYTTIIHEVRKELGLTINDYMVASTITFLMNNPGSKRYGWYYGGQQHLAEALDVSHSTIKRAYKKLFDAGLLEKCEMSDDVRTTQKWYEAAFASGTTRAQNEPKQENMETVVKRAQNEPKYMESGLKMSQNNKDLNKDSRLVDKSTNLLATGSRRSKKLDNLEKNPNSVLINELIHLFAENINPACKTYYGNKGQRAAAEFLITEYGFETVKQVVLTIPNLPAGEDNYWPEITTPYQLKEKWVRLMNAVKRHKEKSGASSVIY